MGAGVAAAHLIVFIAVASVGTILFGVATDAWRENTEAQAHAVDRLQRTANEQIKLAADAFVPSKCINDDPQPGCGGTLLPDRTWANFTNNGSHEIPLEKVTVLVDGSWTDTDTLAHFEVRESPGSNLWIPGETLEIRVEGQGDADVTVVAPQGTKAYRRA